ncbi:MAG: GNAT family N-acetyltransferase, partial [Chloroflexi bacterium]|nr:GNAT family N-acetyltransferase [Chloroflexota bacterium]
METITTLLPRGFTMRAPTMADCEAVTNVISASETDLYGESETTLEEVRTYWQAPGFNITTDAWVVLSPERQIVAAASTDHREHALVYAEGFVHPVYCGLGIGTYLLDLIEKRALEHIPLAPRDARVTLNDSTDSLNIAAQGLLEKQGFKLVRNFWRMGIEMNEAPPTPQWADGITVRTMAPGMERAVFEADQEAFQDHWGHMPEEFERWENRKLEREGFDPSLWFLAMDGDEIAGV